MPQSQPAGEHGSIHRASRAAGLRASKRSPSQWLVMNGGLLTPRPWPSTWISRDILFDRSLTNGVVYAWPVRLARQGWVDLDDFLSAFAGAWTQGPEITSADGAAILANTIEVCRSARKA